MGKWVDRWVYFQFLYGLGSGQTSFVRSMFHIETVGIILALIALYVPELKDLAILVAIPAIIIFLIFNLIFAYILDKKFQMQHRSTQIQTARNPDMQLIISKLEDIEVRLRRIEYGK